MTSGRIDNWAPNFYMENVFRSDYGKIGAKAGPP
jgi:hypothetical protein